MRWMRRRLRARGGGGADSRVHRPRALAVVLKGQAAGWALDGDSASRKFPSQVTVGIAAVGCCLGHTRPGGRGEDTDCRALWHPNNTAVGGWLRSCL